ncbi:hypothetical protein DEU38_12398 [Rhodococcus sp. AG1013]|nr:hypothetical protein DEU38_12398 [Rhodococcus sp. AG1013]
MKQSAGSVAAAGVGAAAGRKLGTVDGICRSIATEGESVLSVKKVLGVAAAAAVLGVGFVTANAAQSEVAPRAPDASAAALAEAQAKANDPDSGLLDGLTDEERDLLSSSKVASALLDATTGAVLSVGEGDFIPEGAASAR